MKQKFVETLKSKGLIKKSVTADFVNQSAEVYTSFSASKTSSSIWQYADEEQNTAYFKKLNADNNYETLEETKKRIIKEFLDSLGGVDKILNVKVSTIKDRFTSFCDSKNLPIRDKEFNTILKDKYDLNKKNIFKDKVALLEDEKLDKDVRVFCCWVKETE